MGLCEEREGCCLHTLPFVEDLYAIHVLYGSGLLHMFIDFIPIVPIKLSHRWVYHDDPQPVVLCGICTGHLHIHHVIHIILIVIAIYHHELVVSCKLMGRSAHIALPHNDSHNDNKAFFFCLLLVG